MSEHPYDRFRELASFLCGYLNVPNEKCRDEWFMNNLASIIRNDANLTKEYKLVHCGKCKTDVELKFYESDEDCSEPHYYCSKCHASYIDSNATKHHHELDAWFEDREEDRIERDREERVERAMSCTCGAYRVINGDSVRVADCCC